MGNRDVIEVAKQIKDAMPKTKTQLRDRMDWFIRDCEFKAPEQINNQWRLLSTIVNESLVDTKWKRKMVNILMNQQ